MLSTRERNPVCFYIAAASDAARDAIQQLLGHRMDLHAIVEDPNEAEVIVVDGNRRNEEALMRALFSAQRLTATYIIVVSETRFDKCSPRYRAYVEAAQKRSVVRRGRARLGFRLRPIHHVYNTPFLQREALQEILYAPLVERFGRSRMGMQPRRVWHDSGLGWSDRTGTDPVASTKDEADFTEHESASENAA